MDGCEPTYFPVGLSILDRVFGENDVGFGNVVGC
jgi:hypothetical protein